MAFHDIRFPTDISFGSSGGPEYSTDVVITEGGFEQRNQNWAEARGRYNVAHGVKTDAQLSELIAFFRTRKGKANAFRFKDWSDYKAIGQVIGTGNGSNKNFQLVKNYISGSTTETRTITKPVSGTVSVFVNGVLQASPSINYSTGLVTLVSAPANGATVAADFEFDVPARFDTDRLSSSIDNYGIHSWQEIPILEVRV
jgi:uncharacterized protein (TIGR02217 family)